MTADADPPAPAELKDASIADVLAQHRRGSDGRILSLGRAVARADRPDVPGLGIKKVSYTHDALIDAIIADPTKDQHELAKMFGYQGTSNWISKVVNSDAFQERLAERRKDIVDPSLLASVETRFRMLVDSSLEILLKKLDPAMNPTADLALATLNTASRALGYGAKQTAVQVNNKIEIVHKVS